MANWLNKVDRWIHPSRRHGNQATMTRWDPFEDMERMRHEMDRFFGEFGLRSTSLLPQLESGEAFLPPVEVYTTDDEVVVKALLPGIEPENINIEVTEDAVHVSGEIKREEEIKEDSYYRTERQYGHFERVVPLPERIKDESAKATFKDGVVTIRAPLAEPVKKPQARRLQIES